MTGQAENQARLAPRQALGPAWSAVRRSLPPVACSGARGFILLPGALMLFGLGVSGCG